MTRILIIGAHGQIAQVATRLLLERGDAELTLYLRRSDRLSHLTRQPGVRVVEGDAADLEKLMGVMPGHDAVYANLSGAMGKQARAIVKAMQACDIKRLIFISSMGIYDEVPGKKSGSVLDSDLDYTILRPAWLDDQDVVAYGITRKGATFRAPGATVSRRSVAELVIELCLSPGLHARESLGVHRQ